MPFGVPDIFLADKPAVSAIAPRTRLCSAASATGSAEQRGPLYDNEEAVCGIEYNGTAYYFLKNLQGDVIAITDGNGDIVANYSYDAWGVCTVISDTTDCNIATINPYRYRGYYYDSDIGMYYLQSRYYDPSVGRFVNGDDALTLQIAVGNTIWSNLYAYCNNSMVADRDINGYITPANIIGALLGAGAGALIGAAIASYFRLTGWKKALVIAGSATLVAVAGWFAGPRIYAAIKAVVQKAVETGRIAINRISTEVAKLLRLVKPGSVKFARTAYNHQSNPARRVPLKHLVDVIKTGSAKSDPGGSRAVMYTINNF